jgi:hypothetical protein
MVQPVNIVWNFRSPYRGTCRTLGNILEQLHNHFAKADSLEALS